MIQLPPSLKQPLIMAGLGTGAAPFRAFLQYLSWRADQGEEIGPVYYYFGSRHQSQEYLYGEEIEAWIFDNLITRAGLAFSRDGPKKVYIQHKMLEDSEALAKMLHDDEGIFYLCGPTWPVPDVYEALVAALGKYKGYDATAAGDYLENLKEEERYVLEVSVLVSLSTRILSRLHLLRYTNAHITDPHTCTPAYILRYQCSYNYVSSRIPCTIIPNKL